MIHDILLSLLNPNCKNTAIEEFLITDAVSVFLHPAEKEILEQIVEIIKLHRAVTKFTNQYRSVLKIRNSSTDCEVGEDYAPKSLYLQSFANGIEIVLELYVAEICELERRYLQSPSHSLLFIFHKVNVYQPLFIYLQKLIRDIKSQKLYGCAIIRYLHQNVLHGNQQIFDAMNRIQSTVNIVLLKHLTHWLLYAKVNDNYDEFFIQYSESSTEASHNQTQNSEKGTNTSAESTKHIITSMSDGTSNYEDIWKYEIIYEFLPHFISPIVAEKILFIGQTVLMFKVDASKRKLQQWNQYEKRSSEEDLLWNSNENVFFKKIQELQNFSDLTATQFEVVIDEIKSYVTGRLSQIAVNQADLVHQLKLIKDFYLLGRGELYLEFIRLTTDLTLKKTTENTIRDIVKSFDSAAALVGITEDLEQFSMTIPKEASLNESNFENFQYMNYLTLQYKINWPLQLLFSPKVLQQYNELFRFLLRVKRLQFDLQMAWCIHRETKSTPDFRAMHLRNQFMFLIDNLQYYIQVDVFESQFSILMNIVQNSEDFEDIQRAHSVFQANILCLCFLLGNESLDASDTSDTSDLLPINNSVMRILNEIFHGCDDFCKLVNSPDGKSTKKQNQYKTLEDRLPKIVEQLMNMLFSLKSAPSSTPLSQLLLRLDYNYWFSKQNQQNKTVLTV